ncbi:hypothetical protein ACWEPB_05070 [Kitasatospora cineracea]
MKAKRVFGEVGDGPSDDGGVHLDAVGAGAAPRRVVLVGHTRHSAGGGARIGGSFGGSSGTGGGGD